MEDLKTWAKRIMKEAHDSLLMTIAKDVGIDIGKVLTEDELNKIAGKGADCWNQSAKDRFSQ